MLVLDLSIEFPLPVISVNCRTYICTVSQETQRISLMIDTISCRVKTGEEKTLLDQLFLLYVNKRK